jgi:DNA-binding transcriptional LysR family regulator
MTAAHGIASLVLPTVIRDFQKLYPKVTFEFRMTQQSLPLAKEGIDVALRVGNLEDSSNIAVRVGNIRYAFVATPNFLKLNPIRRLKDVESTKTITFPHFNNKRLPIKRGSEQSQVRLNGAIVCNSPDLLLNFALQDLGVALLPESLCRDHFKTGQLIRLLEKWQINPVPISLLYRDSERKPRPLSLFIEFLSNYLATALD